MTNDIYTARNTLTRRQLGPISTATLKLTFDLMANGDRAGLAILRDSSAYIGVWKANSMYTLVYVNNLVLTDSGNGWETTATGSTVQSIRWAGALCG